VARAVHPLVRDAHDRDLTLEHGAEEQVAPDAVDDDDIGRTLPRHEREVLPGP
jgi:hypothetical protein